VTLESLVKEIDRLQPSSRYGRVAGVRGLLIEIAGVERASAIGARLDIETRDARLVSSEIVGFRDGLALAMPFGGLDGIGIGCRAILSDSEPVAYPSDAWLGRIINARGEPIDGKGPLPIGAQPVALRGAPPSPQQRQRTGAKLDLGVRVLNLFTSCCRGQRMGIFAGSGVGKSVMLSMLARYTEADVNVIGLVGERGREVQEFIEDDLGEDGLKRSIVIVATSDEPALMRRQAAHLTLSVAEYFRDRGNQVLCLMDSVTRFAMAQREIGLTGGEPPASKGYTPTVFTELSRLLERAGPGPQGKGDITGIFTVLVEGDDHNEPVADAVRGILDGHIVMDRSIAERGRYPAINVLRSVSRTMPACNTAEEAELVKQARAHLSTYADMEELIRLGAYRRGTDAAVDRAIELNEPLEAFLAQEKREQTGIDEGFKRLAQILGGAA